MTALTRSVLVGGVVYPAGTEATEELLAKIRNPRLWGEGEPMEEKTVSVTVDVDVAKFQAAIAAAQERIDELEAALAAKSEELEEATAQAAASDDTGADAGDPVTVTPVVPLDYAALDVDALKAEIDKRNEGRDGDARLSKRGSQETLAAILAADDAAAQG